MLKIIVRFAPAARLICLWTNMEIHFSAKAAIAATVASGLRSVYGYCFTVRVESWSPFTLNQSFIAPFAFDALKNLAASAPFGNGRVTLGVAFDGWFLPHDMLRSLFEDIRSLGIRHITTHNSASPPGQSKLFFKEAYKQRLRPPLFRNGRMLTTLHRETNQY